MTTPNNPNEIAREVFRTLVARRISPTPENYQQVYHEIAGLPDKAEPFPERQLKSLLAGLPRVNPEQLRLARELDTAIQQQHWESFRNRLTEFVHHLSNAQQIPWQDLIGELVHVWSLHHAGLAQNKKKESLEIALRAGGNQEALYNRLTGILKQWGQHRITTEHAEEHHAADRHNNHHDHPPQDEVS